PGAPGLSYMTYLTAEDARAFALDGTGKAVIAGGTERGLSPVTPGAFPSTLKIGTYFAILDPAGGGAADLKYSTVLDNADPKSIAIDTAGRVWLAGGAASGFPAVCGPLHGGVDPFVMVMRPSGNGFADRVFGMFFGGASNSESANGITVDLRGIEGLAA